MEVTVNYPDVAQLGTGTMGAGMARNIAAAGIPLRVWNRSPGRAQPLAEAGARVVTTPAEAADGAGVVLTMLYDADSVADVIAAAEPAPGSIWVQSSTVGVEGDARLQALADELDLVYVDAPVLGTRKPAADGALVVLASGPEEARLVVQPVFDAIGSRTMWLGAAGAGTRLKLAANAWVATVVAGVAQSLRLAEGLGIDPALFLEAVAGGALDAPYVGMKGRAMLNGDWEPSFSLSGLTKDLDLIQEAARGAGIDPVAVSAVKQLADRAVEAGHGDKDMGAIYLA